MEKRKVIQINTHSLSVIFPNLALSEGFSVKDLPYGGGWHIRLGRELLKATSDYVIECWSLERLKHPITFEEEGLVHRFFPSRQVNYREELSISLLRELRSTIQQQEVLIHLHSVFTYTTFFSALLSKSNPVVAQNHGGLPLLYEYRKADHSLAKLAYLGLYVAKGEWLFDAISLPRVDRFFVLNSEEEASIARIVGQEKVEQLTMGIHFDHFKKMDKTKAREALGLERDHRYLLFVGALVKRKGLNYLLEAVPTILKEYPESTLLVIGKGRCRGYLEALAGRLGVKDRIRFIPASEDKIAVTDEILPLYYNAADVFVLPSLTEPLGIVGVEALACETPFVGTNVGGMRDVVKNFRAGKLVRPGDSKALAQAVIEALGDRESGSVDRKNGKKYYDWKSITEKTTQLYTQLFEKYYVSEGS